MAVVALLISRPTPSYAPTFIGSVPTGYQFVEKGGSGYGVYVPSSFDASNDPVLIFAFGRSPRDLQLSKEELKDYADLWVEEAEARGYVVVVPFWQPVLIENNQHADKYYIEMLHEVKAIYNVSTEKVLLTGFGLGAKQAFSLAALFPKEFGAVVTIGSGPFGDRVMDYHISETLLHGLPPRELPPVLLVHGDNDGDLTPTWLEEQKSFLEQGGAQVTLKEIGGMADEHDPKANPVILDWFEEL